MGLTAAPRRVLWLAKGLGLGGAERLIVDALPHLDRQRFAVEVAYVLPWKDALAAAVRSADVPVHCLDGGNELDGRWVARLRTLVRTGRFQLVHTHMPYPAIAARLALGSQLTLVHTEHNVWERYRAPTRWANAWTYGRNRAVIAVSDSVAASIRPPSVVHSPPVEVVVHGIDVASVVTGPAARARARSTLGLDPAASVVGTVGNFTAKKDQQTLLSAFSLLVADHPGALLVLIGSGPLEEELRRSVHERNLGRHVVFAGSRLDVPQLLPAFDVFALSSRYEGLPIALLEALAAGLPCVATTAGGIPEIVTDGREGFLVEPGDAAGLARGIAGLLDDPETRARMARAAATRGGEHGIGPAVRRIQEIYDEVLG